MKAFAILPHSEPIASQLVKCGVAVADSAAPESWDALILTTAEVSLDVLRTLHAQGKPIAGFTAQAVGRMAEAFGKLGVTLAGAPSTKDIYWEKCATDDFISDREHRLITTVGLGPDAVKAALRELIEIA